ncbi:MAG: hypothetical protein P9L93_00020 [Candidatus Gorgyraea atricola]|nr:hypothetical protein [Candidatus Gorgyraea atricola]
MITIKMMDFISKLGDAYLVVYNTLSIIKRGDVQGFIVNTMTQGSDRMIQELLDKNVFNEVSPKKIKEIKERVVQDLEILNMRKVKEYTPILINQNLVMLCTIMETFFLHVLQSIMIKDSRAILGLAQDKNVSLERILELKDYDSVIEGFRMKILEHFSRQGLKEKFKTYKKIMPDIENIFDFSSFTDGILAAYDLEKLSEIFDKRHDVVHKNQSPLKNLGELTQIKDFFEKLIMNLSQFTMNKYAILLDIQEGLVKGGYPIEKMPGQQKSKV